MRRIHTQTGVEVKFNLSISRVAASPRASRRVTKERAADIHRNYRALTLAVLSCSRVTAPPWREGCRPMGLFGRAMLLYLLSALHVQYCAQEQGGRRRRGASLSDALGGGLVFAVRLCRADATCARARVRYPECPACTRPAALASRRASTPSGEHSVGRALSPSAVRGSC